MLNKLEPINKTIEVTMMYDKSRVEIECPLCHKEEWELLDHIRKPIVDNHLCICRNCGFISYNPQLKDIQEWYNKEVRSQDLAFLNTKFSKLEMHKKMIGAYMADNIDKGNTYNNALDFGCSDGYLLKYLRDENLIKTAKGIELNPGHANWARHIYDLDISSSDDTSVYKDGSFDLIVCYHVLEHIQQPDLLLKEFNRILSDTGILYIGLPTIDRLDYTTRYDLFKDEHINMFSDNTLRYFLAVNGFESVFENNYLYGTAIIFKKTKTKAPKMSCYDENIELLDRINACYTLRDRADKCTATGDVGGTKKNLVEALKNYNNFPELIIKYSSLNDAIDEQEILEEYIKFKPHFWELHTALGLSLFREGNFDKAEESLLKATELKGKNAMCLIHLGQIKYYQKDFIGAIEYLRECWKMEPYNQSAFELLATILAKM